MWKEALKCLFFSPISLRMCVHVCMTTNANCSHVMRCHIFVSKLKIDRNELLISIIEIKCRICDSLSVFSLHPRLLSRVWSTSKV